MSRNRTPLLLFLLVLVTTACKTNILGTDFSLQTPTPIKANPPLSQTSENASPTPQPTTLPLAINGTVCFDDSISKGTFRVRECPGILCREIGLLESGAQIAVTGERKDKDEATWLRIISPIDGWVNNRYICEANGSPNAYP